MRVLVIHGPNLNLLGSREPAVYGTLTLDDINRTLLEFGTLRGVKIDTFQSNHEGELLDRIGSAREIYDGILVNAGAYSHTSIALRDAISAVALPTVEVHLSNTAARESFRHHSYIAEVAQGVVSGFGAQSYLLGLEGLIRLVQSRTDTRGKSPDEHRESEPTDLR